MTLDECLTLWTSKKRHMGCVKATQFLCQRVPGFSPKRINRWTASGDLFQHVVATNGTIDVDLAPYADKPSL